MNYKKKNSNIKTKKELINKIINNTLYKNEIENKMQYDVKNATNIDLQLGDMTQYVQENDNITPFNINADVPMIKPQLQDPYNSFVTLKMYEDIFPENQENNVGLKYNTIKKMEEKSETEYNGKMLLSASGYIIRNKEKIPINFEVSNEDVKEEINVKDFNNKDYQNLVCQCALQSIKQIFKKNLEFIGKKFEFKLAANCDGQLIKINLEGKPNNTYRSINNNNEIKVKQEINLNGA